MLRFEMMKTDRTNSDANANANTNANTNTRNTNTNDSNTNDTNNSIDTYVLYICTYIYIYMAFFAALFFWPESMGSRVRWNLRFKSTARNESQSPKSTLRRGCKG